MATAVNPLLQQLLDICRGKPVKVPSGHKTTEQWAAEWKMSRQRAGNLIRAGLENGVMKCARYKIRSGKVMRPIPHYYEP